MPCWYFERKEIRDSPSFKQGIDQATENRYRREGARLILDAGTKLGLRYDTCATGVVYFHRFYTTHSFREFHRYVMSACCLFLAGKVEETPKKCRDIIRTVQTLLKEDVFNAAFGEDPREEVMTTERILLQTVKFDLQVEHPYHFLLNFAKQIKGDKDKIQKMAQMSWTFINDSLCTTLCLQWEPEIIAVSLMYLASRLTKFEPTDWTGRISGSRSKWWEDLIEGMTMELMEDICHQVLDLYSAQQQAQKQEGREVSPPLAAGPRPAVQTPGPRDTPPPPPRDPPPPPKRARNQSSPGEALVAGNKAKKVKPERDEPSASSKHNTPSSSSAVSSKPSSPNPKAGPGTGGQVSVPSVNPYVSSSMYSSSFMSQEGQQSIASLLGGNSATPLPPTPQAQPYPNYPPPSTPSQYHVPPPGPYTPGSYPPPPAPGQYHTPPPYSVSYNAPPYGQSTPSTYSSAPLPSSATPSSAYPLPPPAPYSAPPPNLPPPPHPGSGYPYPPPIGQPPPHIPPPGFGAPPPGNYGAPPPPIPQHRGGRGNRLNQSNLAPVRCISDRGGIR